MNFKLWLEQTSIRGEYWILEDGDVDYADGDVGDITHEGVVIQSLIWEILSNFDVYEDKPSWDDNVKKKIFDKILDDSEEEEREQLEREYDEEGYYDDIILRKLKEMDNQAEQKIDVINDRVDARIYGMKYWGWKTVRGHYVESWQMSPQDMKVIAIGLKTIAYEENFNAAIPPDAEFSISAFNNNQSYDVTIRELEAGKIGLEDENKSSMQARQIATYNKALTANAAAQNKDADVTGMHPHYQKQTFPIGDSVIESTNWEQDEYGLNPDVFYLDEGAMPFIYTQDGLILPNENSIARSTTHIDLVRQNAAEFGISDATDRLAAARVRQGLESFALLGRIDGDKEAVAFWNPKRLMHGLLGKCISELLAQRLIYPNSKVISGDGQSINADTQNIENPGIETAIDPKKKREIELRRALHLMPPQQKQAAMKELGLGWGSVKNKWQKASEKAGLVKPGQKWWASTSEGII